MRSGRWWKARKTVHELAITFKTVGSRYLQYVSIGHTEHLYAIPIPVLGDNFHKFEK